MNIYVLQLHPAKPEDYEDSEESKNENIYFDNLECAIEEALHLELKMLRESIGICGMLYNYNTLYSNFSDILQKNIKQAKKDESLNLEQLYISNHVENYAIIIKKIKIKSKTDGDAPKPLPQIRLFEILDGCGMFIECNKDEGYIKVQEFKFNDTILQNSVTVNAKNIKYFNDENDRESSSYLFETEENTYLYIDYTYVNDKLTMRMYMFKTKGPIEYFSGQDLAIGEDMETVYDLYNEKHYSVKNLDVNLEAFVWDEYTLKNILSDEYKDLGSIDKIVDENIEKFRKSLS